MSMRTLAIILGLTLAWPLAAPAQESPAEDVAGDVAVLSDDGLWVEPWALQSFLVLAEDRDEAAAEGKRLMVVWEQRGCPYCTMLHQVNFADPDIRAYARKHFALLQLNKYGSLAVTDFDGEELEERQIARKYRVMFTPTVQFFALNESEVNGEGALAQEIARMPGYLKPEQFLAFLKYVHEGHFETMSFGEYLGPDETAEIAGTPTER